MIKDDLKDGMLVRLRNGQSMYVLKSRGFMFAKPGIGRTLPSGNDPSWHGWLELSKYTDALEHKDLDAFDIIYVYDLYSNLVWERINIDWTKVPIDTKIYVKDLVNENWKKRHFAEYKDGKVYAFYDGQTSWSSKYKLTEWPFAKLGEDINIKGGLE